MIAQSSTQLNFSPREFTASFSAGGNLSTPITLGPADLLVGLIMPVSGWTTAGLTFQISPNNGTSWLNFYDSAGNEITVTTDNNRYVALTSSLWSSVQLFKVRSGTSGAPVNQINSVSLTFIAYNQLRKELQL